VSDLEVLVLSAGKRHEILEHPILIDQRSIKKPRYLPLLVGVRIPTALKKLHPGDGLSGVIGSTSADDAAAGAGASSFSTQGFCKPDFELDAFSSSGKGHFTLERRTIRTSKETLYNENNSLKEKEV